LVALSGGNPFCHNAFNGEFGNTRGTGVHDDGTKARFPKRVAPAGPCACYRFGA
jgi:hypothetical protein